MFINHVTCYKFKWSHWWIYFKNFFYEFSYWAWSTPWGRVLSLKSFCWNPLLSWAIRYSVFQPVKFRSSFEFICHTIFSTFWHLVVKFGCNKWFLSNKKVAFFPFRWNITILRFFKIQKFKISKKLKVTNAYFFKLSFSFWNFEFLNFEKS